jgi:hypothetical protein
MKSKNYLGWRIYKVTSGSNNGLRSIKAKHPLRVARLEITLPDNGSFAIAEAHIKRDIDAIDGAKKE